jgi:uncharacterized protein
MRKQILLSAILIIAALAVVFSNTHQFVHAQQRAGLTPEQIAQRNQREQELEKAVALTFEEAIEPFPRQFVVIQARVPHAAFADDCVFSGAVKLIDVYPDGRAYNLDETIQRLRYRNGYDKPLAWMKPGEVYKFSFSPMNTSNFFDTGHRVRIEISRSNFPRFDRNLNTGGNNYDETKSIVARNVVHHSKQYPSKVTLTVVRSGGATTENRTR